MKKETTVVVKSSETEINYDLTQKAKRVRLALQIFKEIEQMESLKNETPKKN